MAALVILPGLDGTTTMHDAFKHAAASVFESVVAIRFPAERVLGYAALEEWIRPRLPCEQPFWLLGESFSGPLALSIAASPPPNLAGVILSTTFARVAVPWLKPLAPLVRMAPAQYAPLSLLRWLLLGRWATKPLTQALADAISEVAPNVLQARAALTLQVDVTSLLTSISLPVLYLRATEDRLLAPSAWKPITSAVKHARKVDIEGPHLLLQARPVECAKAIAGFIRSSGTPCHT
ncbi:alpha/beta fold hydrolase [Dyella choica]|uniref:Alpha/beta hydrolase n=1 Tax=Dyella choica TaxID=1927959 RepID=A0A432M4Y9_9GAMM|nr:alpha/beta hydrolase [Dyella choica]RUL74558.1 alpha/beta hydrolase [Dyella choica]